MGNSLAHHGVKGQKWGVRRYKDKSGKRTALGKARYAKTSPRKELENGDYLYKKGTVVGRFGGDDKWDQDNDVTYLYTNEKDRSVYSKRFGGDELTYKFKKDVKMPNLQKQYTDLLEFVKNDDAVKDKYDYALNEPFDFWKDNINQGGKVADRYYSSMKNKGYDALIDFRNVGMTDDPIIILSPKDSLESVKDEIQHSEQEVSKMNQAEVLCHSSGPWKKHKYISKVGEGANAVYKYARKNITGNYYKDRYLQKDEDALEDLEKMDEGNKTGDRDWNYRMDSRGYQKYAHDEKSRDAAEKNYYTKSLFGKIESKRHGGRTDMLDSLQLKTQKAAKEKRIKDIKDSVSRGQEKINKLFKSETKVTVKDTFTGKTRTPSKPKSKSDTINIKQASEKNKKKK